MFQVCGDVWSAMTQIHCHCYVSGLWRCVISHNIGTPSLSCFRSVEWVVKHEINTLPLLCFMSVEMGGQTWDKYTVLVMFQICGGIWSAVFWLLQRRGTVSVNWQVCRCLCWSLCHWQSLWHCHCFCILQLVLSTPLFDGGMLMVTLDSTVWWGNAHGYIR